MSILQTLRGVAALRSVHRPLVAEVVLRFQPDTRSLDSPLFVKQIAILRAVFWAVSELQSYHQSWLLCSAQYSVFFCCGCRLTALESDSAFSLRSRLNTLLQELGGKVVGVSIEPPNCNTFGYSISFSFSAFDRTLREALPKRKRFLLSSAP